MKTTTGLLIGMMLLLAAPSAGAEIYHWVDDQGVPHYTNQKPPQSNKPLSVQEEIPYDAEADRARREAEAAAWKEDLERESREEQARLKLEAERLAAQRREQAQAPPVIIQNNVYKHSGGYYGSGYYPVSCPDGLPPPCRHPAVPPWEQRRRYQRRYYQTSPFYGGHMYYGNALNYRPGGPGSHLPPPGVVPPVGRPPVARPPAVRPPVHRPPAVRPPVARPPVVGRPR